jgi:uncharacterized repeat protein (TIGR03803 family)
MSKPAVLLIALFAATAISRAASPTITVLHAFNFTDGSNSVAPLFQASDGNFYGTTFNGGDDGNGCVQGCDGTVFKITPQGQFTLLHTFVGGGTVPAYRNGRNPWGGLIEGSDGYLYGTTFSGGYVTQAAGGIFYKISKSGDFQKLHDFCGFVGCKEGTDPQGSLVLGHDGYFYGTTTSPPAFPQIFRMSSTGVYSTIKDLYSTGFGTPVNGMVQASDGNLYGVAFGGVYRVTPPSGFSPVYFFVSSNDGSGNSEVIQATDGNLYGATYPGPGNTGKAFRISLAGNHQNILSLTGATTGTIPNAMVQATDGNLWGTSDVGGSAAGGTVFTITTDGAFLQSIPLTINHTGIRPLAPLIQASDGKLYGTTSSHGVLPNGQPANGTVFVVDAGLPPRSTPHPPLADAGGPYNFCSNQDSLGSYIYRPWSLDGSHSSNPDQGQTDGTFGAPPSTITAYDWDFSCAGDFTDAHGAQPDVTGNFLNKIGQNFNVCLRVTNNDLCTSQAQFGPPLQCAFPGAGLTSAPLSGVATASVSLRSPTDSTCTHCVSSLTALGKASSPGVPGNIQLYWIDTNVSAFAFDHYNIYRSVNADFSNSVRVASLPVPAIPGSKLNFIDTHVTNGATYYYRIVPAIAGNVETCGSNITLKVTVPAGRG